MPVNKISGGLLLIGSEESEDPPPPPQATNPNINHKLTRADIDFNNNFMTIYFRYKLMIGLIMALAG